MTCTCGESLFDSLDCEVHAEQNNKAAEDIHASEVEAEEAYVHGQENPATDEEIERSFDAYRTSSP